MTPQKASALHIHCSGLLGDRALSQYDIFSSKMVLKRPFLSDPGEASVLHVHCSCFMGDRPLNQ